MGVRRAAAAVLVLLVAGLSHKPVSANGSVTLETQAWPAARPCEACVPFQFGLLEMRLPLAQIGKILVLGSDLSAVHLLPKNNDASNSILFLSMRRADLIGKYQAAGLLRQIEPLSNQAFFDRLGRLAAASDPFAIIRRIEHLDRAKRYLKASRDKLYAYWIQAESTQSQSVYFVVEGEETVYALLGQVTPEAYEFILANMHVSPLP